MSPDRASRFLRVTAFLTLVTFSFQQVSQAQTLQNDLSGAAGSYEQSVREPLESKLPSRNRVVPEAGQALSALDFLQNAKPLWIEKAAESLEPDSDLGERWGESPIESVQHPERSAFEDALAEMRPEYASAVILESLSEENIRQLLDLDFEVGVVILAGEIVLLTSGSESEILTNKPAARILEAAAFTAHTHPKEEHIQGPSPLDLNKASGREYVLTDQSVYAYDPFDLEELSIAQFLNEFEVVLIRERARYKENSVMARRQLNRFIKEMDLLNESQQGRDSFRASGEVPTFQDDFSSPTTLTQNWTAVKGSFVNSAQTMKHVLTTWSPNINLLLPEAANPYAGINVLKNQSAAANMEAQAAFTFTHLQEQDVRGVIVRYQDAQNYYVGAYRRNGKYELIRVQNGIWTIIGQAAAPVVTSWNEWLTLKVRVEGHELSLYANGVLKLQVTDSAIANGKTGIYSNYQGGTDDFKYWVLGGSAQPPVVQVPTVAALPSYTNNLSLSLSGTKTAGTSIWIDGVERVPANASTSWSYNQTLTAGDGLKTFSVLAKDAAGTSSSAVSVSTTLDHTLPAGTVSLQGGTAYTTLTSITATLTASDALSGLDQVRYQVNGTWSAWESFSASKSVILPAGDGTKTILYEIRDKAGNVRQASDTIVLDATAPSLSLIVSGGNTHTNTLSVNAALTASDAGSGIHQMRYQIAGGAWSAWENYASSKQLTLPAGDGAKDVRFEVRDTAGNVKSAVSSVTLDTVAPVIVIQSPAIGSDPFVIQENQVTIQYTSDGQAKTKQFTALLTGDNALSIQETDMAGNVSTRNFTIRVVPVTVVGSPNLSALPAFTNQTTLSLSGTKQAGTSIWINGTERVPANASTSWSYNHALTPGDGLKTFSVLAKDAAGTSSSAVSVSTTLDQTLPAGSVSLQGGAAYSTLTSITATLTASDALSGLDQVRYQVNGTWSAWEAFSSSKTINLATGDGIKTVLYEIRDKAGNVSQASDTIVLDATAPMLSLVVNGGNAYTKALSVNAALTASDAGSGLHQRRYQIAGSAWSAWETYAASKQITLPAGDGSKEVRFEVRDNAGNVKSAVSSVTLDTVAPLLSSDSSYFQSQAAETGLGGYWNFNEVSGTSTEDGSGNDNHGILVNGPVISSAYPPLTSHNEGSLQFDGVNDYVTTSAKVAAPQEFTVSLWFKASGAGGRLIGFGNNQTGNSTGMDRHVFMGDWGHLYFSVYAGGIQMIQTPQGYSDGQWHHLTASMSSAGMALYVDGQLKAQKTSITSAGNYEGYWRLGGDNLYSWWNRPYNYYFKGNMDEARVYNRQLTLEEIQTLAQGGSLGTSTAPETLQSSSVTVSYKLDGVNKSKTFSGLVQGENELRIQERDAAGNISVLIGRVHVSLPDHSVLGDGTQVFRSSGVLQREVTPSGDQIFYRPDGSVEKYRFANGHEIYYATASGAPLLFYNELGVLTESLGHPQVPPRNETEWIRVELEGGLSAFYYGEALQEILTETGIRITGISFDASGDIQRGTLFYPDGSIDVIRDSKRIRRVESDGTVLDYLPTGLAVREIFSDHVESYRYEKASQTEVLKTIVTSSLGSVTVYDDKGLLLEVRHNASTLYYERQANGAGYRLTLDRERSSSPDDKTLVEGVFSEEGVPQSLFLEDGTRIDYAFGRLSRVTNASDEAVDYDFEVTNGFVQGLTVSRNGNTFEYASDGFLKRIETASGTVTRAAQDTDHDGKLTDEQIIDILLDETGGNRLTDFELDADGNILNGIIHTREGIKQRIQNGVLTGYETLDGKWYEVITETDGTRRANLSEWRFHDGTKAVYGGGSIAEILFPDGRRLHSIGMGSGQTLKSYVETLPDGVEKHFLDGRLVKMVTAAGALLEYGLDGRARKLVFDDGESYDIEYLQDEHGALQEIVFKGNASSRIFSAAGALTSVLAQGVRAEFGAGEIERIFTRYGFVQNPQFNENGLLSGDIRFADGIVQTIQDGEVKMLTLDGGKKAFYEDGRLIRLESSEGEYRLSYADGADSLQGVSLAFSGEVSWVQSLIPYLLDHPDSDLARLILSRPLHNALHEREEVQSDFETGDTLYFARLSPDSERGDVYGLGMDYLPYWTGLDLTTGYENSGAVQASRTMRSWLDAPSQISTLADMNGDGLADRIMLAGVGENYWWVQLNSGQGLSSAVKWTGVDSSFNGGALHYQDLMPRVFGTLTDINGDGLPDRVLQNFDGSPEWQVQLNNGTGFNPSVLWGGAAHALQQPSPESRFASEVWDDQGNRVAALIDLDGDGLPDRVLRPYVAPFDRWFWQKNLGNGFADAMLWEGVSLSFNQDPKKAASLSVYAEVQNNLETPAAAAIRQKIAEWDQSIAYFNTACANLTGSALSNCRASAASAMYAAAQKIQDTIHAYGASYYAAYMDDPGVEFYSLQDYDRYKTAALNAIRFFQTGFTDTNAMMDLNGDQLPDRILLKSKTGQSDTGAQEWWWQKNTGEGFELPALWDADVRALPGAPTAQAATSIRYVPGWLLYRDTLIDLTDLNGDGLPDRVTMDRHGSSAQTSASWWVEINTGTGFAPAVEWTGIYGTGSSQTAIQNDMTRFRHIDWGAYGPRMRQSAALKDISGDGIPDRVVFEPGSTHWKVQLGTGTGFLPVEEILIEALRAPAEVNTSRYDYLHVSLKSETQLSSSLGQIKVTLGDPSEPESYQEWTVQDTGTAWKDYFLPLNPAKGNADQVRVEYIPASSQPSIPVYVDNLTFTGIRPPAGKDWLDRLLAEENVLSELHSDRNQTLVQYLGYADSAQESSSLSAELLQTLLNAETRLDFGTQGQLEEFETSYGSISKVENGRVIETVTTDGTRITFDETNAESSPGSATRTIEDSSGNELVQQLSYGRVRQVIREGRQPLQYSYEFDSLGREITVVHDPETDVTERYRDIAGQSRILSRKEANGVSTVFKHDSSGERTSAEVMYKGRIYETYHYGKTDEGLVTVAGDAGVVEEYDSEGVIRYHTTADGYRYAHSFENAHSIEVANQTETETLPDQTVISFQIPVVTLKECESGCENVHRVSLTGYTSEDGTEASYQDGDLKSLKYADGTRIFFSRSEVYERTDAETGEILSELLLMDAVVVHPDGASTEYRGGKPYAVQRPNGQSLSLETEQGHLINPNESALFHYGQALKLWSDYLKPQWSEYIAPGSLALEINYDTEGQVVTRRYAEGVTEIYDNGRISMTVGSDGERLTHYQYDEDGNIVQVTLEASRRRLASSVLRVKAEIAMERQKALSRLADREQVLNQTIEGEYVVQRDRLLAIRARIEAQAGKIASLKVKGKAAKTAIGDASSQIQAGLDQVNRALEKLAQNRIDALEQLSAQVNQTSGEIEENAQDSYEEISEQESLMQAAILRHEISPVIYHWYRKILGRDPSKGDYDLWISRANYAVGTFDLPFLKNELLQGDELAYRTAEVDFIKNTVTQNIQQYLTLSSENKVLFADALGIPADKLVSLSHAEAERLLSWLNSRSLHFGQSAYVALESMLAKAGIAYERRELARRLILIDILTGTLTPMENGDLLISMFALKTVAALYGLSGEGYSMNYQSLKALYDSACPSGVQTCQFRVIAHIDGNHYIVVTKVTEEEVTFIETGSATRLHQDLNTMSREEFIASWTDASNPANRFGYIFSAQPPPAAEFSAQRANLMDDSKLMRVRGAFFIAVIVFAVLAVAKAVIAAVAATIAAISAIISGIAAGIGSILSGFGSLFSGLFTGQFLTGLQGLFHGLVTGIGQIAGAVFQGVVAFGHTFAEVYGVSGMILKGVELSATSFLKSFAATSFVKGTLTGSGIGLGFQGAGKLLEVMGVAPQISQTLMAGGKIMTGAVMLGTGNVAGLGLLSGGSGEFLSLHTDLSPAMSGIIGIGAAALGAFAGGVGSLSGLEALKSVVPHLSMDLASSGLTALGDALKLDPRITSLASIPLRAAIGNGLGKVLEVKNYESILSNIKRDTLAGFVSVGANIGLNELRVPLSVANFVSSFLGQVAMGFAGEVSDGGGFGSGKDEGVRIDGRSFLTKIGDGIEQFARGAVQTVGNIVSIGAKVIEGVGSVTVQGVKDAVKAFSGLFSRQTMEGGYADEIDIRNVEVQVNGNDWSLIGEDSRVDYNFEGDEATEYFGVGGVAKITGAGIDEEGNLYYTRLEYETATQEVGGATLKQAYVNNRLIEWGYYYEDNPILTVKDSTGQGWTTSDGWLINGNVEFRVQPIEIPAPQEPESNPLPAPNYSSFDNFFFNFKIFEGKIAEAGVEVRSGKSATQASSVDTSKFLFGNGFNNEVVPEGTYDYLMPSFVNDLAKKDLVVDLAKTLMVPMYETTGLFGNLLDWAQDFIFNLDRGQIVKLVAGGGIPPVVLPAIVNGLDNNNNLIEEVKNKLLDFELKRGFFDDGIAFAHSGFFAPLLGALEQTKDDGTYFDVHTVINYEGPHVNWSDYIDNPNLKSIINVWGTAETVIPQITGRFTGDYYVDSDGDLQPINDPTKKPVPLSDFGPSFLGEANFTGPAGITNINIEIKDARHNDFSYDPTIWNDAPYQPEIEVKEVNRKTNEFMRRLYKATFDDQVIPNSITAFLESLHHIGAATFVNGIWKIDTDNLPY